MFSCTTPFVFMLTTVKKTCSNHAVKGSFVYFVISIDPLVINTSIFHGYTCWKDPIISVFLPRLMR